MDRIAVPEVPVKGTVRKQKSEASEGNGSSKAADVSPPHSVDFEQGALSCVLQDCSQFRVLKAAGATRRWFYVDGHKDIFSVLEELHRSGRGFDYLAVHNRLKELGILDKIGGEAYLSSVHDCSPSAHNLSYYIPDLLDKFRRRMAFSIGAQLQLAAQDTSGDSARLLDDIDAAYHAIRAKVDESLPEIVPAKALLADTTGLPAELVGGVLHKGSKLILGGSSKSYKTWSLTDLAISVATGSDWLGFPTHRGRVLFVNFEIQQAFFRRRIEAVLNARGIEINDNLDTWNLRGHGADYRTLLPKIRARLKDQGHDLLVLDPTYKLLGSADENSATDIAALLNAIEDLVVHTGAAVAMAGHFAKGNASQKEAIDRISGSGVFARDPDSLVMFTKHESEGSFTVEMVLRNLPPVPPFVVTWHYPLFLPDSSLDPAKLKQPGRPPKHSPEVLLECLGDKRLLTKDWQKLANENHGIGRSTFFELVKVLSRLGQISKSAIDEKWEKTRQQSGKSGKSNK